MYFNMSQCVPVCWRVLQRVAMRCNVLSLKGGLCVAASVCCSTLIGMLHCVAVRYGPPSLGGPYGRAAELLDLVDECNIGYR